METSFQNGKSVVAPSKQVVFDIQQLSVNAAADPAAIRIITERKTHSSTRTK